MKRIGVWAPRAERVEIVFQPEDERVLLEAEPRGSFGIEHPRVGRSGQRYGFSLDGGPVLPDPRSVLQPEGVHGPSSWVDFETFTWTDEGFQPRPLASSVVYELHVGTFTQEGTFDAVIPRLLHLKELGVTHVELMPVSHFPGVRGWGYDGVSLFAPHTTYGGPEGLMRLVNAAHAHGIAVLLDVVYNHLGPSGNYLGQYGPYFTNKYHTPWGDALNYDEAGSAEVRRFICDNALHWLRNYHIDGLRLDAVHAIFDQSATHILAQLAQEVNDLSTQLGRRLVLIAESGLNDVRVVNPEVIGGYAMDAQWSDDFHHALHCALTGESAGYYKDYRSLADLAEALRHGFVYRGQFSEFRNCCFGGPTEALRGRQLLGFIQNHDQVGNRALGDRLAASLTEGACKLATALTLMAPFVPMLFMGEEWGAKQPFQYFVDHQEPELQRAVKEGRQREFAAFGWDPEAVPDPTAESTFGASRLDWTALDEPVHQRMLIWTRCLLALRKSHPALADDRLSSVRVRFDESERWLRLERGTLVVCCHFGTGERTWEESFSCVHLVSDESRELESGRITLEGPSVVILESSHGRKTS